MSSKAEELCRELENLLASEFPGVEHQFQCINVLEAFELVAHKLLDLDEGG